MGVLEKLNAYMADEGLSGAMIARSLGVSSATVSQYRNGKYMGDIAVLEEKILGLLSLADERRQAVKRQIEYVITPTAQDCFGLIRAAHIDCELGVLVGSAGLGKTAALKEYAKNNKDSVLIETDPSFTARVMTMALGKEIGVNVSGNLNDMLSEIIERLKDSGRVLLIDEAELLPLRALEVVRRIHDKAGVGVVLVGMPRLIMNLRGRRGELGQLYSRVAFYWDLGERLKDDDLLEMVNQTNPEWDGKTAAAVVASARGNVRRLVKLICGVRRMASINQQKANVEMVKQFSKMLIQ